MVGFVSLWSSTGGACLESIPELAAPDSSPELRAFLLIGLVCAVDFFPVDVVFLRRTARGMNMVTGNPSRIYFIRV